MHLIQCDQEDIRPGKIVCIGRNYVDHIAELGNEIPADMVIFSKPGSAISDQLHSHHGKEQLHYEGEICFLVMNGQFGAVAFGLDLTKRQTQARLKEKGLPWERAKAFDGSAVFSNFTHFTQIEKELTLKLFIDNKLRQHGSTAQMMYKPRDIFNELSSFITLEDGDIVMTGTPAGVGTIETGAVFHGVILDNDIEITSGTWEVQS